MIRSGKGKFSATFGSWRRLPQPGFSSCSPIAVPIFVALKVPLMWRNGFVLPLHASHAKRMDASTTHRDFQEASWSSRKGSSTIFIGARAPELEYRPRVSTQVIQTKTIGV
jgi:hypothetical protein